MSNEIGIQLLTAPTGTPYALVRNSVNQIWDDSGNSLVAYVTANLGLYDLPMTEQGTASRYFIVSFPTDTELIPGVYTIQIFDRLGGSPAETDTFLGLLDDFQWDGGLEIDPNIVQMELAFNVDNPNTQDEYSVIFKINGFELAPSQITGTPSLRVGKRDDTDLIATLSMTQVSTTARWIHDEITLAERVILGEAYYVTISATLFGVAMVFDEIIRRDK